jgi:hypothetical protein
MPKELPLTQGKIAIVDDGDFLEVSRWKWTWTPNQRGDGYAARWERHGKRRIKIYLHRFLMDAEPGQQVDHVNGDSMDNRRANLRVCTAMQNYANRRCTTGATSRYRGVYRDRRRGRWCARVSDAWLGSFDSEEAAARAYDTAAVKRFGEFARLNFPGQQVA